MLLADGTVIRMCGANVARGGLVCRDYDADTRTFVEAEFYPGQARTNAAVVEIAPGR